MHQQRKQKCENLHILRWTVDRRVQQHETAWADQQEVQQLRQTSSRLTTDNNQARCLATKGSQAQEGTKRVVRNRQCHEKCWNELIDYGSN